jgi:HEAT repeat protein
MLPTNLIYIILFFSSVGRDSIHSVAQANVDERLPGLIHKLSAKNPRIRMRAIRELKGLGRCAAAAAPYLVKALGDEDSEIARAAASVLTMPQMGSGTLRLVVQALGSPDKNVRSLVVDILEKGDWDPKLKVRLLIKALGHRKKYVRLIAAAELDGFKCPHEPIAIQALLKIAQADKDREIRLVAIGSLGGYDMAAAPAIPFLLKVLR